MAMTRTATDRLDDARRLRNEALGRAIHERSLATREAEIEYSETVAKLRERFEADLAEALRRHRTTVRPAHQAFNAAMLRAEQAFADAVRSHSSVSV